MSKDAQRMRVSEIDWISLFPVLRLFECFRMALDPSKLAVALLMVVVLYVGGTMLDLLWGARVYRGEIEQFASLNTQEFDGWRRNQEFQSKDDLRRLLLRTPGLDKPLATILESSNAFAAAIDAINQSYSLTYQNYIQKPPQGADKEQIESAIRSLQQDQRAQLEDVRSIQPRGIFETALEAQLAAFNNYVASATSLHFGLSEIIADKDRSNDSVLGAMRQMFMTIPAWILFTHPWYSCVLTLATIAVVSFLGGSLFRIAAVQATRGHSPPLNDVFSFALSHWLAFFMAPLIPLLILLFFGALLALIGLLLFNWPVLEIVGALVFGGALVIGLLMALLLAGFAGGLEMLYPAVAVDGADAFDANSRAMSYLRGAPWRWLVYNIVALVFGAVSYFFLGTLVFLAIRLTQASISIAVFRLTQHGSNRFEAILAPPRFGQLTYHINWSGLDTSGKIAATLVGVWVYLLIGFLGAFAISFAVSAQTWIYLLLRRAVDATELDELEHVSMETNAKSSNALPDKIEATSTNGTNPDAEDAIKP